MAYDSNYSSVSLLLHANGTNGSTTFTDNSPSPKTITRNGSTIISTAQSKYGGSSALFDGTSDSLSTPNHTSLIFGTGMFTIEVWVYANASSQVESFPRILSKGVFNSAGAWNLVLTKSNGLLTFEHYTGTTVYGLGTLVNNTWNHIAVTRDASGVLRGFLNGTLGFSATDTKDLNSTTQLIIGAETTTGTSDFTGYIDDLRITKGVARYTSSFSVPTSEFANNGGGEIVGSGNITFSGTSTFENATHSHFLTGSGNITLSGTSTFENATHSHFLTGSGNITFSPSPSTFLIQRNYFTIGSGNILFSGTTLFSYTRSNSIIGSGNITFTGTSGFSKKMIGAASSSIVIDSTLLYHQLTNIIELINLSLNSNDRVNIRSLVSDFINIIDSVLLRFNSSVSENLIVASALTSIINRIELLTESLNIVDTINTKCILINQLLSLINVLEEINYRSVVSISETISISLTITSLYKGLKELSDSIILSETSSSSHFHKPDVAEVLSLNPTVSSKSLFKNTLSDLFIISIPTSKGSDNYLAYLLSPETNSISNYTNYNFDGCTKFDGKYLFYNTTGLYEYGGTLDDTAIIRSRIETVAYNFNSSNLKQVPSVYLGINSSGATLLKVKVDGKADVTYKLNKKTSGLQTQKIDIGKGLIGRYFQFEIITDSSDFNMESIEFFPIELKRKL